MSRDDRSDIDFFEWVREEPERRESPAEDWERARTGGGAPRRPSVRREEEEDYRPWAEAEEYEPAAAPRRARRGTSLPLILVMAVLVGGMIFAAWQLGSILLGYHRDRSAYNDLASAAISTLPAGGAAAPEDGETEEDDEEAAPFVSQVPIAVDWEYLRSVNSEVVGWLYCPGTIINYPVVQVNDNDFYLDHGFDREWNTSGALFADMDSALGIRQSNYIIYGHNMKDKSMFGSFQSYVNESYYEENPVMYYLTPDGAYRIDLFGAHVVEGIVDNFPTYFGDLESYQSYINEISSEFYWFQPALQTTDYQLMTLSTCTSASGFSDARLVLHGVMVPIE